jgi:hypothetical protein
MDVLAPAFLALDECHYMSGQEREHSRAVDEAFRTAVEKEVIQQTRDEPAAARRDDGSPDPVVVTKRKH